MRLLKFNSIPLALCVFTALFMATQMVSAQNSLEPTEPSIQYLGLHDLGLRDLGVYELHAREREAQARHAAELAAIERARQALELRNFDAATRASISASITTDTALPPGVLGLVQVSRPREMTMLQLRGMAGSGSALLRLDDGCISIPLRFVAGDFGGDSFSARRAAPIRIAIQSQDVLDALLEGDDVISDMVEVSTVLGAPGADLVLLGGLTAQHGFVINPGRSLVDDIFGVQGVYVPCRL